MCYISLSLVGTIMKTKTIIVVAAILLTASSTWALVLPRGSESTLDIATWNVRDFPRAGTATIDTLAILIRDLQLDIIGIEEITDTAAFASLLARLPGWAGVYAPSYAGSILKDGILYRTDQISLISYEAMFFGDTYQFPRQPLRCTIQANLPSGSFDFYLIVLHLKAGSTDSDVNRRQSAMIMLKNYLDVNVPSLPDRDWLVIGDYNDQVDDPQSSNVFFGFLQDTTNYRILTLPLAGNPYWASYPSYNSLIDHILITSDALSEYGENGQTQTLRLDDEYSRYSTVISDHRPVLSRFTSMQTGIENQVEIPQAFSLSSYPNPFNATANISARVNQAAQIKLELYDCLGRKQMTLADQYLEPGSYIYKLDGRSLSSGVYFVRFAAGDKTIVTKINLIK
jgi:endonuclease/exonuclease/phosphatase family metal-dependent hydrolase